MKISIITSCFNRSKTIEGSIRSVFSQDYSDIEYIIVDGNSNDGTQGVIESVVKDAPQNVIVNYISEPDHGMYEAINKGIRMATGDVIALCHSDDFLYDSHVVSDYMKAFETTEADFIYSDGLFVDENDINKPVRKWIGGEYSISKVKHGWLPLHPTCYIKREVMNKLGLYDETYKIAADSDLLVRYLLSDDIKVHYLKGRFVVKMRMGGLSTDSSKRQKMWDEDIRVYTSNGFKFPVLMKVQKMIWKVPQFIKAKFMK